MSAPQRSADPRSPLVFDVRGLGRRAGAMTTVTTTVPAPADLGIEVVAVPAGAPVDLDLRFEAVVEGVLVTGTAQLEAVAECVRCLTAVRVPVEVDVQELFVHDASAEAGYGEDDEVSLLVGDLVDLEPVLRDGVVLDLPFQPLCSPDCAGLCPTCGARLDDEPDHHHDGAADPRWAGLGAWSEDRADASADAEPAQVESVPSHPYDRPGPARDDESSR